MKKITQKRISNNVARYGALSLAITGIADVSGQVNYTDVDPDFEAVAVGDELLIDLNDDGVDEFNIVVGDFGGNDFTAISTNGLAVPGMIVGQAVGNYTYALNLDSGATISSATGAFANVGSLCYLNGIDGTFCGENGATPNGFAGVSFDLNGNTHYGWIALENVSAGSFTVTGFAFEETAGTTIAAGDQGATANVEDQVFANFTHSVNNGILTLDAQTAMSGVEIYDITGKRVINSELTNSTESINISSLNTGAYIVRVNIEGADKTFKIVK